MRRREFLLAAPALLGAPGLLFTGCKTMDMQGGLSAVTDLAQAATITDAQVTAHFAQMIAFQDKQHKVLGASSKHGGRLARLTAGLKSFDGLGLDFKVYESAEINAFAAANGSIRFHSALLDMLTDDEVRYVIGHEIGHIRLGHSKARLQAALATSAARKTAAASGNNAVAALAESELGDLVVEVIRAQHSQGNENAADDFAVQQFLTKIGANKKGAVSSLEKLARLGGGGGGWTSTHPSPAERASRLKAQIA